MMPQAITIGAYCCKINRMGKPQIMVLCIQRENLVNREGGSSLDSIIFSRGKSAKVRTISNMYTKVDPRFLIKDFVEKPFSS